MLTWVPATTVPLSPPLQTSSVKAGSVPTDCQLMTDRLHVGPSVLHPASSNASNAPATKTLYLLMRLPSGPLFKGEHPFLGAPGAREGHPLCRVAEGLDVEAVRPGVIDSVLRDGRVVALTEAGDSFSELSTERVRPVLGSVRYHQSCGYAGRPPTRFRRRQTVREALGSRCCRRVHKSRNRLGASFRWS